MANKLVTLRLGDKLLKEIDSALDESSFDNRTDFIKHAVRMLLREVGGENTVVEETEKQTDKKTGNKEAKGFVEEIEEELRYVR